jgi:endoglucanase
MRERRRTKWAGGATASAVLLLVAGLLVATNGSAGAGEPPLSIAIVGNHFVNGDGQTVRLLGVDAPSTEYACEEGWGYGSSTVGTVADAAAIATWHADAVRIPLNEDCWLGINGQPSYDHAAGAAAYQSFIETWVDALNAEGIYAILDLHWSAPGADVADGQLPMPDDHSAAFWTSVATAFRSNPAVLFDAFNEPFSPQADGDSPDVVSWSCWDLGGCVVPDAVDGTTPDPSEQYTAVGMQALVTAIRATGATQPILLGGLSYANDLSGWLANEPTGPDRQLAASFHNYAGETCDTVTCWNTEVAPVAAEVPVVTGEFDQGYDCVDPPSGSISPTDFDNAFMDWADTKGVSYLAWGWWALSPDPSTTACTATSGGGDDSYALIDDDGAAMAPDGTTLQAHLAALAAAGAPPPPPITPPPPTTPAPTTPVPAPPPASSPAPAAPASAAVGYDLVGSDGGVFTFPVGQTTGFYGSLPGLSPPVRVHDIVGIVPTTDDRGYFLVGADGGVFGFGDSTFEGSLPGLTPPVDVDDIVGIVPTTDDRGYFLVGRDGGVFAFGDAAYLGSLPGSGIDVDDVVGIATSAGDRGYWTIEADGIVHGFGEAAGFGNAVLGGSPVAGMAATPNGDGYWVVDRNGAVQAFGDAVDHGSLVTLGITPAEPVVALVPTPDGGGYWLVASDGGIFGFGDATANGSLPALGVVVGDVVGASPVA